MPLNLDHKKRYLLACSFGPDSMSLFAMLLQEGYDFAVAHVNYGLRPEAKTETEKLVSFCQKHHKLLFIEKWSQPIKGNIEGKCREIRYQFFAEVYHENNYDVVLIAHNQDDVLETYFLQKARKNFVLHFGLSEETIILGMNVIRPLLSWKKADLLQYCLTHDIPFAIDSSNLSDDFARNRIRHQRVEKMDQIERQKVLNDIHEDNLILQKRNTFIDSIDISLCSGLLKMDFDSLAYALNKVARNIQPSASLSKRCILELQKVLKSEKPNISVKVNKQLIFNKAYERCHFSLPIQANDYSYLLDHPGVLDTPYFYLDFTFDATNRNVKPDDYPLTIRNVRPHDVLMIKNYAVESRRLFIDWKMPICLRNIWPVIVNNKGVIIYIPRYQKDFVVTKNINFYVK